MIVTQLIGGVALVCVVLAYQAETRQRIMYLQFAGSLLFATHFLLLGAMTGAALNLVAALRAFVFAKYKHQKRPLTPLITIIGLFVIVCGLTWEGPRSLLPMIAMVASSIGFWQLHTQRIRWMVSATSSPLWLIYNVLSGSIPGIATEVLNMVSALVGLWRYRTKKPAVEAPTRR